MEIFFILKANMKSKKGTMFSIFGLLFFTSFCIITVISIHVNAGKRYDDASSKAKVPDITAVVSEDLISGDLKEKLEKDSSVDYVEMIPKIYVNEFSVVGKTFQEIHGIGVYQPEEHHYEIYNEDGLEFIEDKKRIPQPGEIFVPIGSMNRYKCGLGDTITYTFENGSKIFKIAAFIEEPYSGCTLMGMKRVFINAQDFNSIANMPDIKEKEIEIYFTQQNTDKSDTILRRLSMSDNLSEIGNYILTKQDSKMFTMMFTNILSGILLAFSVLLFVIILIIIGFSVNMSIEMDYMDFGVLKSQGFSTTKIRIILLLQYLISGGIGCILGFLISGLGIKYISQYFVPITGLYISNQTNIYVGSMIIIAMLFPLAVFILLITKKIRKIYPMQAINGGKVSKFFYSTLKYDISKNINMPLSFRLVNKNLIGKYKQYISMVLIVGLLLFFLMTTASIKQIENYENVSNMFGGSSGEIQISFKDSVSEVLVEDIKNEINNLATVSKIFKSDILYFSVDGLRYLGNIVDGDDILKKPFEGREPENENEIIITDILSKILEKGIGDTVKISYNQVYKEFIIVGLNQDTSDVGKCFGILEKGVQRLDNDYQIKMVNFTIKEKEKADEITTYLQEKFDEEKEGFEISNQYQYIMDQSKFIIFAVNGITALIFLLALFFVGVITFIICSKIFMQEYVDMGIAKSLGFSTWSIRGQFTLRFFIVSLAGSIIGLIANLLFGGKLMEILLGRIGMDRIAMNLMLMDYILPILFIIGSAVTFAWLSSGRIKKVSPKDLINL